VDLDRFQQTAAWLEYCDGMSRFHAESEAARRQYFKRWEILDAIQERDFEQARYPCPATAGQPESDVSELQPHAAEEDGYLPERQFSAGRHRLELLALRS
jgi:hypothetical protein